MIEFEKTNDSPIRLVFRGDSTPDYVKSVSFMDDDRFMVFTDNDRVINLLDFLTGTADCYDHRLKYNQIIDNFRGMPSAIPNDWRFIKRVKDRFSR